MPEKHYPLICKEAIIEFANPQNVLVRYFVSPEFQLKVKPLPPIQGSVTTQYSQKIEYDTRDKLDEWLLKNTIPFVKTGRLDSIQTHLFFGGPSLTLSLCRIAEQIVFEKYGAIGPAEGAYHRVVEIKTMPEYHGVPSFLLDEFSYKGYYVAEESDSLVKRAFG